MGAATTKVVLEVDMLGLDLSQIFVLSIMSIPPGMLVAFAVSSAFTRLVDRD